MQMHADPSTAPPIDGKHTHATRSFTEKQQLRDAAAAAAAASPA